MFIYMIKNNLNGKIYIGQTTRNIAVRFAEHCRKSKTVIDKAIKSVGKENFTVIEICQAETVEKLNELERYYIKKYNAMNPEYGYNLCDGGDNTCGYHHRKESREKMSKSRMGIFVGEKNPFYGKHHTNETKKRLSELHSGKHLTEEHKRKVSENSTVKRPIICITTGEKFSSIREAARKYDIEETHISRVCRGKRKSCKGYSFVYDNTVPSPQK